MVMPKNRTWTMNTNSFLLMVLCLCMCTQLLNCFSGLESNEEESSSIDFTTTESITTGSSTQINRETQPPLTTLSPKTGTVKLIQRKVPRQPTNCEAKIEQQNNYFHRCVDAMKSLDTAKFDNVKLGCSKRKHKLDCIETSHGLTKNCFSEFEQFQFTNQIQGLRAFISFQCNNNEANLNKLQRNPAILECAGKRKESINQCKFRFGMSEEDFLPPFQLITPLDKKMWTREDCMNKKQWMYCIIGALDICTDKSANKYYGKLYNSVMESYPACASVMSTTTNTNHIKNCKLKLGLSLNLMLFEFTVLLLYFYLF